MAESSIADSPEATTFQRCFDVMKSGLKNDLFMITTKLFARSIISQDRMNWTLSLSHTPDERSFFLTETLLTKVQTDPPSFYKILEQIHSCPVLQHLESTLIKELNRVEKEQQRRNPSPTLVSSSIGVLSTKINVEDPIVLFISIIFSIIYNLWTALFARDR